MANFELPFPLGGLNDNIAQSKQPSGTTGEAVNVRGQDPVTGRIRGAQRSGLTKFTVQSMDARIKRFEKVVYDNRQLKYKALSEPQLSWEKELTNAGYTISSFVDKKENLYVTTSNNKILKYNQNGILIFVLSPTVDATGGQIAGIAVDDDFGLYVSVGHKETRYLGQNTSPLASVDNLNKCWIIKYLEQPEGSTATENWRVYPKAAIEKLIYLNGNLFALGNDPINFDGILIKYEGLSFSGPIEVARRNIAYPATDFDLDVNGSIYWTAAPNQKRLSNAATPYFGFRKSVVDWTPVDIDDPDVELWSWYAADAIQGYEDNEELLVWDDLTGKNRNWIKNVGVYTGDTFRPGRNGPKFRTKAFGGKPCLQFLGNEALSNTSTALSESSSSTAAIPNVKNKATTIFLVIKPTAFESFVYIAPYIYANKEQVGWLETSQQFPITSRTFAIGSGSTSFGHLEQSYVNVGRFSRTMFRAFGNHPNDVFSQSGKVRSTVTSNNFSPTVSGFGAGMYGNPYIKITYSAQDAYIITQTTCNSYFESLNEYNNFAVSNYYDDGVNPFDSIRVNGHPLDRWYGRLFKSFSSVLSDGPWQWGINGHSLGCPYNTYTNQFYLYTNVDQPLFPQAYNGYIAEMVVVKHNTQAFVPRYPRTIGLANATYPESLTRLGSFTTADVVGGSSYAIPALYPFGAINGPSGAVGQGLANLIPVFQVSRLNSNKIYAGVPATIKTNNFYYPVWFLDQINNNWYLALGDLNKSYASDNGVNLELNPVECRSIAVASNLNEITDCERIEGYLAWKYGIWHNLPAGSYAPPTLSPNTVYDPGHYPHPFALAAPSKNGLSLESVIVHPTGIAACLESIDGQYKWAVNGSTDEFAGGIGWSIALDSQNNVFTYGPQQNAGFDGFVAVNAAVVNSGNNYVAGGQLTVVGGIFETPAIFEITQTAANGQVATVSLIDAGSYSSLPSNPATVSSSVGTLCTLNVTYNSDRAQFWSASNNVAHKIKYDAVSEKAISEWQLNSLSLPLYASCPKVTVDKFNNVVYPAFGININGGTCSFGWTIFNVNNNSIVLLAQQTGNVVIAGNFEKTSPSYKIGNLNADDFPTNPVLPNEYPRAENLYIVSQNLKLDNVVARYVLVKAESSTVNPSPRSQVILAVSNGSIKKITTSAVVAPAGLGTLTQPELDASSPYIDSAVLFGKIYFTDGLSYCLYDPRNDIVSEWQATDAGTLPNRCKLLTNWRGRAVLARGADDPHNWHMSEQGNATGWDTFPPVQTATQAISGNNARAGLCPDLINSLIPYNDDLLLFGCDSSLWMMRGDPMAGGVFDLVSDVTGVAFGRSWAKDPEGTLYFFGSRGGVYMMKPGGIPVSMTQSTIERRLTEVNLSQFYVEMFWNTYDDGLHLLLMPFTDTATQTKHYFWERKSGAWYEDKFYVAKQPSAAVIVDGDAADDRCLLIGTYDASVVKWDKNATSDDGAIIESKVVIGPVAPDDSEFDSRITNLAAVMAKQGAVNYKLYASTTPDERGEPVASGQFVPGRNPIHLVRARGAFVWVELQQANAYTRWSLESMRLDAFPAGRKRNA